MKPVLTVLFALLLTGCLTEKKQARITHEYLFEHPEVKEKICGDLFDETVGEVIPGKPIVVSVDQLPSAQVGELISYVDSLKLAALYGKAINIDSLKAEILKKCKTTTIHTRQVDTLPVENKDKIKLRDRAIVALDAENQKLRAEKDEYKGKYTKLLLINIGIIGLVLLILFLKFKLSGLKKLVGK